MSLQDLAGGLIGGVSPDGSPTIGGWVDDEYTTWALGSVIAELGFRSGLEPDSLDYGSLDGRVRGVMHLGGKSALSTINSLSNTHLFDISSYDGRLNFIPRNLRKDNSVVATIPLSELLNKKDGIEKKSKGNSFEIPARLKINYLSPDGDVDPISQLSERSYYEGSVGEDKIESVEILTDEEAFSVVNIAHKLAIQTMKGEFEFSLSREWIRLVVGDVVMLGDKRVRITSVSIDTGKQTYKAEYDNSRNYESSLDGVISYEPIPAPEDRVVRESVLEIMDLPLMDDSDDTLGISFAAERTSQFWNGVVIDVSVDGGQSYYDQIVLKQDSAVGYLKEPLQDHFKGVWDYNSKIVVTLVDKRDTLEPYSKSQALNRRGMVLVGNEVISYTDSQELDKGVWELTGLIRGRKGTSNSYHNINTRFVLLDEQNYESIGLQLYDLDREYTLKITSVDAVDSLGNQVPPVIKTFIPRGNSQKEAMPAKLGVIFRPTELEISWLSIGRLGGGWRVSNGVNFDGFKITLNGQVYRTTDTKITIPRSSGQLKVMQVNKLTGDGVPAIMNV